MVRAAGEVYAIVLVGSTTMASRNWFELSMPASRESLRRIRPQELGESKDDVLLTGR